jgi:hypothetical protein
MKKRILSMILLGSILLCSMFLVVRPVSSQGNLSPWATLWGAGALWAANGGTRAAYIDQYDNLMAYPNPCMSADSYLPLKNEIVSILESEGFTVDTFATFPANLTLYNLVYLEAYFASPADEPAIRSYISNGGGFVAQDASINYLVYNSTNLDTGSDLSSIADWFGASVYVNAGGDAYVSVQNPLGTSLTSGEQLITGSGYGNAGLQSMIAGSQVLATWSDGSTFAFTNTYGQGRVFWQVNMFPSTTQQPPASSESLSLTLLGGFDYGAAEAVNVKVFAELRDAVTMEPISGANVTIQVYDPNDTLWVSAGMFEAINGTGIYEWDSPDTIANMNLQPGVYLAQVTASIGSSSASEITAFHIDPSPSPAGTTTPASSVGTTKVPSSAGTMALPFILAMIVALVLGGILIAQVLLRKASKRPKERST